MAYWTYGLGKCVVVFTSRLQPAVTSCLGPRMGQLGHVRQILGASRRLHIAAHGIGPADDDYRISRRQGPCCCRRPRCRQSAFLGSHSARLRVETPSSRADQAGKFELRFEQKNSGLYEAEFKADEAGSYFINAQSRRPVRAMQNGKETVTQELDSIRAGVTIPYSPEFADMESNVALLNRIRDLTGGVTYSEEELGALVQPSPSKARQELAEQVFRAGLPQFRELQPIWYWLVLAAAIGLFFDVAIRRIALQPSEAAVAATRLWNRFRHRAAPAEASPKFIDRLQSIKQQVGASIEQQRAARRFEGDETAPAPPIPGMETAPAPPPPARPSAARPPQEDGGDYASRLMKAKKKVWEERERPDEPKGTSG